MRVIYLKNILRLTIKRIQETKRMFSETHGIDDESRIVGSSKGISFIGYDDEIWSRVKWQTMVKAPKDGDRV